MQTILVYDINNAGYSWIADKIRGNPYSVVFVFNKVARRQALLTCLKYGLREVAIDLPEKFFNSLLKQTYHTVFQICRIMHWTGVFKQNANGVERDYLIWKATRLVLTQKAMGIDNDEEFYSTHNHMEYLSFEDFQRFKKIYQEAGIFDFTDVLRKAIDSGIQSYIDNLFVYGAEDTYPLLYQAIDKCIRPQKLYWIGDWNKTTILYANPSNIQKPACDYEIDLSQSFQVPLGMYNYFCKVLNKLEIENKYQSNNREGKVLFLTMQNALHVLKTEKYELACVAFEYPLQGDYIETMLFHENIPFKGAIEKYRFPIQLYTVKRVMDCVMNNRDVVTHKELKTVIESIDGRITDKFGGKIKLLNTFRLPVLSARTLHKTQFFAYLIKAWTGQNFHALLRKDLMQKWLLWKGKLTKDWLEPKVVATIVTSAKSFNPDLTLLVRYSSGENSNNLRNIYTMLTVTDKKLIIV